MMMYALLLTVACLACSRSDRRSAKTKTLQFTDYEPQAFAELRSIYGISNCVYAESITSNHRNSNTSNNNHNNDDEDNNNNNNNERVHGGSSGAFMFYSSDGRFIVKTTSKAECQALCRIVRLLANYMKLNSGSLLTRYCGCHSIRLYTQEFYFIVMENVFYAGKTQPTMLQQQQQSPQHYHQQQRQQEQQQSCGASACYGNVTKVYDIKGSWVDRNAKHVPPGRTTTCAHCNEKYVVPTPSQLNAAYSPCREFYSRMTLSPLPARMQQQNQQEQQQQGACEQQEIPNGLAFNVCCPAVRVVVVGRCHCCCRCCASLAILVCVLCCDFC